MGNFDFYAGLTLVIVMITIIIIYLIIVWMVSILKHISDIKLIVKNQELMIRQHFTMQGIDIVKEIEKNDINKPVKNFM